MTELVFTHGWGFDKSVWDKVLPLLLDNIDYTLIDLGFTGNPSKDIELPDNAIYVGHSLGSLWSLKNMKNPAGFIAICGFDCFFRYHSKSSLKAMQLSLKISPKITLKKFYSMCDTPYKNHNFDKIKLSEWLTFIQRTDEKNALKSLTCPIKALACRNDGIVPEKMSKAIWAEEQLEWIETGGHMLSLTQPEFCAKHINDMIEQLK